jgi:prolyl-tRNA editing enzyme YbaK/EbsC (Cys-tRNA(Pro) deacylase)
VKRATGFSIGGVAPLAHQTPLPILVDESLRRFDPVYAAAGHPHCVFAIKLDDLVRVSGGRLSAAVSEAPG